MMRALYRLLGWLVLPFAVLKIYWRGRHEPGYRRHVGERLGVYALPPRSVPLLWVHAVSLGETRAAKPLIEELLHRFPQASILLTHLTATGREAGAEFACDRVFQAWLPWDLPFAVERFFAHFQPRAGILIETELWPNLLHSAAAHAIPMYLVNGRLSERSARGYARLGAFGRDMFAALSGIAAQTPADRDRFLALGAREVTVTGNLKFDLPQTPDIATRAAALRRQLAEGRRLFVAGSTREGEEELLLDALQAAPLPRDVLTVIVPRHPQRFDAVARLISMRFGRCARRSEQLAVPPEVAVMLGDSVGEMAVYYAAADVVFIGGSLLSYGCQNLIEVCAAGAPLLIGPSTYNFAQAAELALACGAALPIADALELVAQVRALLDSPARRAAMREAGLSFVAEHRGASARLLAWLAPRLSW